MSSIHMTDPLTIHALATRGEGHFVMTKPSGLVWKRVCCACAAMVAWHGYSASSWLRVDWWPVPLPINTMCGHCGRLGGHDP